MTRAKGIRYVVVRWNRKTGVVEWCLVVERRRIASLRLHVSTTQTSGTTTTSETLASDVAQSIARLLEVDPHAVAIVEADHG